MSNNPYLFSDEDIARAKMSRLKYFVSFLWLWPTRKYVSNGCQVYFKWRGGKFYLVKATRIAELKKEWEKRYEGRKYAKKIILPKENNGELNKCI